MTVALTDAQNAACKAAIVPVELHAYADVPEAIKAMATVLPLVVAVNDAMPPADRTALSELAQACGAEVFEVEDAPAGREFALRILGALTTAERRRFKRA
jgi:hypothetical protein